MSVPPNFVVAIGKCVPDRHGVETPGKGGHLICRSSITSSASESIFSGRMRA
jgi:hypothetical protein